MGEYLCPAADTAALLEQGYPTFLFPVINSAGLDVQTHYVPRLYKIANNEVDTSYMNNRKKYLHPDNVAATLSIKEKIDYKAQRLREDPLYVMILTADKEMVYGISLLDLKRQSQRCDRALTKNRAETKANTHQKQIYRILYAVVSDIAKVCANAQDPNSIPRYSIDAVFPQTSMKRCENDSDSEDEDEGEGEGEGKSEKRKRGSKKKKKKLRSSRVVPVWVLPFLSQHIHIHGNMAHFFENLSHFMDALSKYSAKGYHNECYQEADEQLRANVRPAMQLYEKATCNKRYQEKARIKTSQKAVRNQAEMSKRVLAVENHQREMERRMNAMEKTNEKLREENVRLRERERGPEPEPEPEAESKREGKGKSATVKDDFITYQRMSSGEAMPKRRRKQGFRLRND